MMYTLLVFIVILIFSKIISIERKRRKLLKKFTQFNGPPSLPVFGNILLFIGTPKGILRKWRKLALVYDSPYVVWMFNKPFVVIKDPVNFQIVANKTLHKDTGYQFVQEFLGQGLITAHPNEWRKNRRLLNPAFNPTLLNKFFLKVFNSEGVRLIRTLDNLINKEQFNLWPYILKMKMNEICLTAMNYSDNGDKKSEYGQYVLQSSQLVSERYYNPLLHPKFIFALYKYFTGRQDAFKNVHDLPFKIIENKRKQIEKSERIVKDLGTDNSDSQADKIPKTFVDILLNTEESKYHFSNEQLADEVVTILLAGTETTAIASCTTLLMLAIHQNVQEDVYAELYSIFEDSDRPVEIDDIKKMHYLEQCIKETMRLYSVIPIILRKVVSDIQLEEGKVIPAGTSVCMPISMLHLNPSIYKNPCEWNPNNFAPEEINKRSPSSFVPFSTGPRSCLGAKYAMLSIKALVSILLRRYHFSTNVKQSDITLTFDLTLKSVIGYPVSITNRKKIN